MTPLCPHCHAPEQECPELLAACRGRKAAARLLYARANGSDLDMLRAENEALRLENERLRRRSNAAKGAAGRDRR